MILCHKCSGVLAYDNKAEIEGLLDCGCISGYVRGFEPNVNRAQAIEAQQAQCNFRIDLYRRQGREQSWIDSQFKTWERLSSLKV